MRTLGVILVIVGIAGFLVTGVSYTTSEEVVDVGPLQVEQEEERSLPITPVASGILVVAGGVVMVVGQQQGT